MMAEQLLSGGGSLWTRKQREQAKTRRGHYLQRPTLITHFLQADPTTFQRALAGDPVNLWGL